MRVLFPSQAEGDGSLVAREALSKSDTWAVRRVAEHGLACRPERRYWLPRGPEPLRRFDSIAGR